MNIKPMTDRIIVKPIPTEDKTPGGIIIPDSSKEKSREGIIAAVGPGFVDHNGKFIKCELLVGQRIVFGRLTGTEIKAEDGLTYLAMREGEVLAVYEE